MKTSFPNDTPRKWPFPPVSRGKPQKLTRGSMVVDIFLVAAWGALIPGLMWLGVAGGF